MVEVEEGMGEVEDTDQSRHTLTSPLRVTNTTVASLTHLVEGATQATVRTREKERESLACVEGIAVFLQHSVQRWAVFCCHFLHLSSHIQPENSLVSIVH